MCSQLLVMWEPGFIRRVINIYGAYRRHEQMYMKTSTRTDWKKVSFEFQLKAMYHQHTASPSGLWDSRSPSSLNHLKSLCKLLDSFTWLPLSLWRNPALPAFVIPSPHRNRREPSDFSFKPMRTSTGFPRWIGTHVKSLTHAHFYIRKGHGFYLFQEIIFRQFQWFPWDTQRTHPPAPGILPGLRRALLSGLYPHRSFLGSQRWIETVMAVGSLATYLTWRFLSTNFRLCVLVLECLWPVVTSHYL